MDKLSQPALLTLLDTHAAAKMLGVSASCLNKWRQRGEGEGPRYRKIGAHRVRYSLEDLQDFIARAVRKSTSDTGQAA